MKQLLGRRGGRFGGGEDDFSRGRKFSADDLQLLLVALLADEPRSNGFYTPSPGMVYPALTYLEEIGYATVTVEGNRKRYAITAEGRTYVEANRERIDFIWAKLNFFARKMGMVRRALAGEEADDASGSNHSLEALMEARHRLKRQLMARLQASPEEQLRIAQVLERAVTEIAAMGDPLAKENDHVDD